MKPIELTYDMGGGESATIDSDKINWIRDTGFQRVLFMEGPNVVAVKESRQEIVERIYAVDARSPGVLVAVMLSFAFLAGVLVGWYF